ncbi:MAG: FecR family protein [Candidatus Wallbacteria bacterium]|nr:FecR family protein [Candidatus Wallbacteria bacterium]
MSRLLSFFFLLILCCPLFADEEEYPNRSYIRYVRGDVRVKLFEGPGVKATCELELSVGDRVRSGTNSIAEIVLAGTALIRVRADSEFVIPQNSVNTKEKVSFIQMLAGTLWARAKQGNDSLKIATPNAICGVRGTEFILEATANSTRLTVCQGEVAFVPLTDGFQTQAISVKTGKRLTYIPKPGKPGTVETMLLEKPLKSYYDALKKAEMNSGDKTIGEKSSIKIQDFSGEMEKIEKQFQDGFKDHLSDEKEGQEPLDKLEKLKSIPSGAVKTENPALKTDPDLTPHKPGQPDSDKPNPPNHDKPSLPNHDKPSLPNHDKPNPKPNDVPKPDVLPLPKENK